MDKTILLNRWLNNLSAGKKDENVKMIFVVMLGNINLSHLKDICKSVSNIPQLKTLLIYVFYDSYPYFSNFL